MFYYCLLNIVYIYYKKLQQLSNMYSCTIVFSREKFIELMGKEKAAQTIVPQTRHVLNLNGQEGPRGNCLSNM